MFETYTQLRKVQLGDTGWTLTLWDTERTDDPDGRTVFAYTFAAPGATEPLFSGEDFRSAAYRTYADDSDQTLRNLLGFLTLRPGDTDDDYFEKYTTDQLAYCAGDAEELSLWALETEAEPFRDVADDGSVSPAWPSVAEVATELEGVADDLDDECHTEGCDDDDCAGCTDVRLQCDDSGWSVHSGDAQYDTDHRGYWGASSVSTDSEFAEIAADLIDQAKDDWACGH